MAQFVHDGIKFNYEVIGEGLPFFLLHGLGNDNRQTLQMYQPRDGIMCVFPDQRGHGHSEGNGDMSLDTLADDVIKLADHLGVGQFVIGGISMGAAVSLRTCLRYPERVKGLLLIRNAWCDQPMAEKYIDVFAALSAALKDNDRKALESSEAYQVILKETPETAVSLFEFFEDEVSLRYYDKFALVPPQHLVESADDFKKIRVPVVILANRQDEIHPYRYGEILHRQISGSQFHEIACKKANRELYHGDINRALDELLEKVER